MARKGSKQNKRRQGMLAVVFPWLRRFGLGIAVCVSIIWLSSWLVISGAADRAWNGVQSYVLDVTANAGFRLKHVYVYGRYHADAPFLLALLNAQRGDPLFSIALDDARDLIQGSEWVRAVRIERRWPDTVIVHLTERKPSALWDVDGKLHLIDEQGVQIKTDRMERFSDLVIVTGDGAAQSSPMLLSKLRNAPPVLLHVLKAKRMGDRRWDLYFRDGFIVKMPEDDSFDFALSRLADLIDRKDVFDWPDIKSIDLRFSDQFIVETKRGGARDYLNRLLAPRQDGQEGASL